MTVQDLRPNSQDTSAFYLGNIYGVLADPNVTRTSIPSPANPPPFSPPRYTVWVNTLWFLSLVMSLSCALWATSLHQWARRYIRLTQPARCSPEKRARMRAYFANGADEMGIPLAVEGLPTLLHLSLFLFLGGLCIFLFNVDQEVFNFVVSWIGFFSVVYGLITLLPLIRHDSPYNTPLSMPAWFLYARIQYVALKVLTFVILIIRAFIIIPAYIVIYFLSLIRVIASNQIRRYFDQIWIYEKKIWDYLKPGYKTWHRHSSRRMSGGVEKKAVETAEEQSSEIDVRIFGWTIRALGDDDSLEKLFEAIPGLLNSKLVKHLERDFPETHLKTFWGALNGFMGRTFSSNSATESVKSRRAVICGDITSMMPCFTYGVRDDLKSIFDQAPVSMERLKAMARWFTHKNHDIADLARVEVANRLVSMPELDHTWIAFAGDMCGLEVQDLRDNIAHGRDNVLLATLIHVSRRGNHSQEFKLEHVWRLTGFDIRHTLPMLQHDFCTLWNEIVQEAKKKGSYSTPVQILVKIRHYYITLHQSTDAAPTAFSPSTDPLDRILFEPWSYPLCDIASHRPDSITHVPFPNSRGVSISILPSDSPDALPHQSTSGSDTVSQQTNIIAGPPSQSHPATSSEIGDTSQALVVTSPALPVHTSPRPTDVSPPGALAAALQDIPPATTLSRPPEDIVAPCAWPNTHEILSTASMPTPTLAPVAEYTPTVLGKSSTSCDADTATASNPILPTLSVLGSSVPASPPPSRVPATPIAEFLALLDGTTPSRLTGNAALPHVRARGLVNTGGMCFSNAVLQLLVHSPPLWNLFRQLGDLKELRGEEGPATGGGTTPLVDATIRFFEEFINKEKEPPPTRQPPRQAAAGKLTEGGEEKKESNVVDSFEPTDIYDAMKEKRKLKGLLVRSHAT